MSVYLEALIKDYQEGNVVPFIGSGLSAPFNVPTWGDLITDLTEKYAVGKYDWLKHAIEVDLENRNYWGAVDMLKKYVLEENEIQEEVVEIVRKKKISKVDNLKHNYFDLSQMNFKLYLTTNYENILQEYLKFDFSPILLKDIDFNTQNLFSEERVCQLHGTFANAGSIVLSKESYEKLYNDDKYENLLKLVTGTKKLLFIGFSFDDQFIKTLIQQHKSYFKGNHYILLNNPEDKIVQELKSQYGLRTISYDAKISSHSEEIRKILTQLSQPIKKKVNNKHTSLPVVIGAGLDDYKKNLKENLFFKKLVIENIDSDLMDLSSDFYIAADIYIREMRKMGIPIETIKVILGEVLVEYKDQYIKCYKKYGNSEKFLITVHESLENIDFGRYKKLLEPSVSSKHENRGFIHILADDEAEKIWWGKERFDEV